MDLVLWVVLAVWIGGAVFLAGGVYSGVNDPNWLSLPVVVPLCALWPLMAIFLLGASVSSGVYQIVRPWTLLPLGGRMTRLLRVGPYSIYLVRRAPKDVGDSFRRLWQGLSDEELLHEVRDWLGRSRVHADIVAEKGDSAEP